MQRLKRRYRPDSVAWVQHGNRGCPMPWALPLPQKQMFVAENSRTELVLRTVDGRKNSEPSLEHRLQGERND